VKLEVWFGFGSGSTRLAALPLALSRAFTLLSVLESDKLEPRLVSEVLLQVDFDNERLRCIFSSCFGESGNGEFREGSSSIELAAALISHSTALLGWS
jgi:hypothetical protein